MSKLIVGPFNRVEGDLELALDIEAGHVAKASVNAPLYRGFEQIMLGRPAMDALVVAPRICGICSVAQSYAAAAALGEAMGVEMPPLGRLVGNLVLACENMLDHLTHFYLYFMPDFARPVYAGRVWHEQALARFQALHGVAGRRAVKARLAALQVIGILAGKWPHSLALQPGGVTKSIDIGERMRLQGVLADFRQFLESELFGDRLERIASLDSPAMLADWLDEKPMTAGDFRFFLRIADDLDLRKTGRGPARFLSFGAFPTPGEDRLFAAGFCNAGHLSALDASLLSEDLSHAWMAGPKRHPAVGLTQPDADKSDAYSWCKAPRLDGASCEVGAFARQMVNGHPLIRALAASSGGRANPRDRVLARLLELALVVPAMERWVRDLAGEGPFCVEARMPEQGQGVGMIEAARGSLGHWLTVEQGRIAHYQIVAPTTWNFSPRDEAGHPGPLEEALVGAPAPEGDDFPVMVQHIVRSFDPCMGCTVH